VISVKDPVSGKNIATGVPTTGIDGALWNAAFMWNGVQKDPKIRQQKNKGVNPINHLQPMSNSAFFVYTRLKEALSDPAFRQEYNKATDFYINRMFPDSSRESIREALSIMKWEQGSGLDYKRFFGIPDSGGDH